MMPLFFLLLSELPAEINETTHEKTLVLRFLIRSDTYQPAHLSRPARVLTVLKLRNCFYTAIKKGDDQKQGMCQLIFAFLNVGFLMMWLIQKKTCLPAFLSDQTGLFSQEAS